jgi:hypothetical protein
MLFFGCGNRGLFSKKSLGAEEPTPSSELPHRPRPAAMASGAAVHRSSGSAPEKKAATGGAKEAPRAGQRIALSDITNLVVRGCGELGAADSAPDVVWLFARSVRDRFSHGWVLSS